MKKRNMMYFVNDYSEGCFPEILSKLSDINYEKITGYGCDQYCEEAAEKIKKLCGNDQAQVYFMTGGTQTNQVVIDALLDSFDGVVAASTGHVNVHEAGAIEYTGHKVMTIPSYSGKIKASDLDSYVKDYYNDGSYEHMVRPGMVYISHPTEYGTLYTKQELTEIRHVCDKYHMPLYLDGARLACGLTAKGSDVTLKDIAELTDVFYIGGTKCGALFGEAVVWTKNNMPFRFNTRVKQHGAMTAKGWLAGIQFDEMFSGDKLEDTLYLKGGDHANRMAGKIKDALVIKNYKMFVDSPTNQIFVVIDNDKIPDMLEKIQFSAFEKYDDSHTVMRFVTSWATDEKDVDDLISIL